MKIKNLKRYLKRKLHIELPISELIDIVLENKDLFSTGLCTWFRVLYVNDKLTFNEYSTLFDCILQNNEDKLINTFWWSEGDIKPRIEFLQKLKTKYENK